MDIIRVFLPILMSGMFMGKVAAAGESVPPLINYQGRLVDAQGNPLTGEYRLMLRLFDAPTEGHLVWGEAHEVAVADGVFNVFLGGGEQIESGPPVSDLVFAFAGTERYLETTILAGPDVAGENALLPRQQLMSVPYAIKAERAAVAAIAESLIKPLADALNPPGTIIAYGGPVSDEGGLSEPVFGYLLCNGAAIDVDMEEGKFAELVRVLGTAWGRGGDITDPNFANLPDLRGVFLRGWSGSATDEFIDPDNAFRVARLEGGNEGNRVGSFQVDEFKSHTHPRPHTRDPYRNNDGSWNDGEGRRRASGQSQYPTGPAGGAETRPKNANVVYLIKY